MIRAIFFDFYGVWLPDRFSAYIGMANQESPQVAADLQRIIERYFHGQASIEDVAGSFRMKLNRTDIDVSEFRLQEADISPEVVDYLRMLHAHFFKVGVLANLGPIELDMLNQFNAHNNVLEVIAGPLAFGAIEPLISAEIFDRALKAIGEPTRSCLVVSNNPAYLQFAASLGIATSQFAGFPALKQFTEQLIASESVQT